MPSASQWIATYKAKPPGMPPGNRLTLCAISQELIAPLITT